MNSCHQHDNTNGHSGKKHMPHWLHMVLCCGIPVLLLFLLPYISKIIPGAASLGFLIPLICPLMMGFMMFGMHKSNSQQDKQSHCETQKSISEDTQKV